MRFNIFNSLIFRSRIVYGIPNLAAAQSLPGYAYYIIITWKLELNRDLPDIIAISIDSWHSRSFRQLTSMLSESWSRPSSSPPARALVPLQPVTFTEFQLQVEPSRDFPRLLHWLQPDRHSQVRHHHHLLQVAADTLQTAVIVTAL